MLLPWQWSRNAAKYLFLGHFQAHHMAYTRYSRRKLTEFSVDSINSIREQEEKEPEEKKAPHMVVTLCIIT